MVTESFDGKTTIGKISLSPGVLVVPSSNVSKESVGTVDDTSSTLFAATEFT